MPWSPDNPVIGEFEDLPVQPLPRSSYFGPPESWFSAQSVRPLAPAPTAAADSDANLVSHPDSLLSTQSLTTASPTNGIILGIIEPRIPTADAILTSTLDHSSVPAVPLPITTAQPATPPPVPTPVPAADEDAIADNGAHLTPGEPTAAPASAPSKRRAREPESGFLTVNAAPWARVAIDGKALTQTTPIVEHKLPAGKHTLTLTSPSGKVSTLTVTVRPHQTTTRFIDLRNE